jgi:signal transduction histidine kinase
MIRSRLVFVFSALVVLALAQAVFTWWAASTAAHLAERSVNATRMLAEYLEISGNKQRLKVWYAQLMLANDPAPAVRTALMAAMEASVRSLRELAELSPADELEAERAVVATVAQNLASMAQAIDAAERPGVHSQPAEQWRTVLLAFDQLAGRDMRQLLREAVDRHEVKSLEASAELAAALGRIGRIETLLAGGVMALALFSVLYFVRRLDRPFAELTRLSSALAAGDFSARSRLAGRDEFVRIGSLLDSMAARLAQAHERSHQLQQQLDELVAERTRSVSHAYETLLGIEARRRRFLAELSHELRTPATVIRGEAEVALRSGGDGTAQREALERIIQATGELGSRVQDLLDAARGGSLDYALRLRKEPLDAIVRAAVGQMQAVAGHRGLRLHLGIAGSGAQPMVDADRERLQQAILIVLDNALRYSPGGGSVQVDLSEEPEHWVVSIEDEGPGMSAAELAHAFEGHYRGEVARTLAPQGQGLGLPIALRIVEAMGGSIELDNRPAGGMRVGIVLPKSTDEGSP